MTATDILARVRSIFDESNASEAQRSGEWLKARARMLTASDAYRAIGGEGEPARTALIMRKRWPDSVGESESSPAMQFGTDREDFIRDRVSELIGKRVREVGLIRHRDHRWLGASVDGLTDDGTIIEIKAPYRRTIVHGTVPPVYMAQVQVQLEVLDLEDAIFVEYRHCWPLPEEINLVRVSRDREWFKNNFPAMRRFIDAVLSESRSDEPPPPKKPRRTRPPIQFDDTLYP